MTLLIILLVVLALLFAAAAYFFRFTFARAKEGGDWGNKPTDPRDIAFFEDPARQALEIRSRDGLRLKAWFYDRGGDTTILFCHGYRGGPEELAPIARVMCEKGCNALMICQRACSDSEGAYFTMGARERYDLLDWIDRLNELRPGGEIVLFGWSMGASTVMGALGEELPENVRCAVCDCGYENLFVQLEDTARILMPKLPLIPFFTAVLDLYCRLFKGFSARFSPGAALAKCRIPVLFVHGAKDQLVPYENLDRCYAACASRKLRSSYAAAMHTDCHNAEPERYFGELEDFVRSNTGSKI